MVIWSILIFCLHEIVINSLECDDYSLPHQVSNDISLLILSYITPPLTYIIYIWKVVATATPMSGGGRHWSRWILFRITRVDLKPNDGEQNPWPGHLCEGRRRQGVTGALSTRACAVCCQGFRAGEKALTVAVEGLRRATPAGTVRGSPTSRPVPATRVSARSRDGTETSRGPDDGGKSVVACDVCTAFAVYITRVCASPRTETDGRGADERDFNNSRLIRDRPHRYLFANPPDDRRCYCVIYTLRSSL